MIFTNTDKHYFCHTFIYFLCGEGLCCSTVFQEVSQNFYTDHISLFKMLQIASVRGEKKTLQAKRVLL